MEMLRPSLVPWIMVTKDDVEIGEYSSDEDPEGYCVPENVVDDPDPTEQEIAAVVFFAEDFMSRFGGEDEVLAGNMKNDVLREMSDTGWEDVVEPDIYGYLMTPYEPVDDTGSFPDFVKATLVLVLEHCEEEIRPSPCSSTS
ncbi:hypothetical protein JG688_00016918 [Phytophthora aleatoria]|uniref:Uncharacterized protein n=1 Tax=Phytophthora aleatoria TaxID=2496075 RepID=A0A8J5LVS3_9STRA|nr:hypothetical protein JG688_00016918 [Phytophthora aleatoria]